MNTIHLLTQYALKELKDTYPENEIRQICRIIFMDIFHYTNIDIHIKKYEILDESFVAKFYDIITELKTGRPIQYIIGETEFAGLKFRLNKATLIPRPETGELVMWVQQYARPGSRILDIGTGSGCIAVSLASLLPDAQISALDISQEALDIARENATTNNTSVHFITGDILHHENLNDLQLYDIIVSNPPYIRNREKVGMDKRVLDFEPHRALFVPDNDPLIFYSKIAEFGKQHLKPGGLLFFEINEALGQETVGLLIQAGYTNTELKKDMYGRDRMCKGKNND